MGTNDAVNCPITSCKLSKWRFTGGLFGKDVDEAYTDETYVKVNDESVTNTFDLYFKSDYNELGGKEVNRLQLECSNGKQTARSKDQFNYKQLVNPCLQSVSKNTDLATKVAIPANKMAIPYTTSTDKLDIFNFEKMYNVANVDTCGLTCQVLNADCKNAIVSRLSLKDNWNLQAVQNYPEGYGPDSVASSVPIWMTASSSHTLSSKSSDVTKECHPWVPHSKMTREFLNTSMITNVLDCSLPASARLGELSKMMSSEVTSKMITLMPSALLQIVNS